MQNMRRPMCIESIYLGYCMKISCYFCLVQKQVRNPTSFSQAGGVLLVGVNLYKLLKFIYCMIVLCRLI